MITNIVVSRYNRNTDFAYKINNGKNINVIIYDKESNINPNNIPVNKGQEASVYLKYIVDYYDSLSEYTFFIHDEEYSWHHSGSIIDKYNEAILNVENSKYYNINDKCFNSMNQVLYCCNNNNWTNDFKKWYNEYIEIYVPFNSLDINKVYRNSAQFLVHKDIILMLPKSFYEKLYNWIITTDYENAKTSRFLEWTWHIFWVIYPNII
jgi:hypothetical protein